MEQSIASSQGNIRSGKRASDNWKSILARPWFSIAAKKPNSGSNIWQSSLPLGSEVSGTLDIERISAKLRIEKRAESDGRHDQPPSTEERLLGTQREIVVYFKELQRKAQHQITEIAYKLRQLGDEIDLLGVGGSLRDIPSRCENEILRLIAESQSRLNFLGERETQQQKRYTASLEKSEQKAEAERPLSPVFIWIFLAFLIGVGAIAIAKYSVSGFGAQSLVPPPWAMAISAVIVLASSVIAGVVSQCVKGVGGLTGFLAGATGIGLIGMIALLAGEYISAVTANPGIAVRGVIDSMVANPIAIVTDVADWKAIGIAFSVGMVAFVVGYRPDNSQPSHGTSQGAIYRTRRKRDRLTRRLRTQINAIIDAADSEARELPRHLKLQVSNYSNLVDEARRIPASLSDYDVALEDGCGILLDRYRSTNASARKTDVPMSFSEHISFRPEHESYLSMFNNEEGRLEEFRQGIVELESEAADVRQKLRDLNSRAINALEDTPSSV
jgi:hypothetical protein